MRLEITNTNNKRHIIYEQTNKCNNLASFLFGLVCIIQFDDGDGIGGAREFNINARNILVLIMQCVKLCLSLSCSIYSHKRFDCERTKKLAWFFPLPQKYTHYIQTANNLINAHTCCKILRYVFYSQNKFWTENSLNVKYKKKSWN